jgi:hypothetical protein
MSDQLHLCPITGRYIPATPDALTQAETKLKKIGSLLGGMPAVDGSAHAAEVVAALINWRDEVSDQIAKLRDAHAAACATFLAKTAEAEKEPGWSRERALALLAGG